MFCRKAGRVQLSGRTLKKNLILSQEILIVLAADEIRGRIACGGLAFDGSLRGDALLLRLGATLLPLVTQGADVIDVAEQSDIDLLYASSVTDWDTYVIDPGQVVLAPAIERLHLSSDLTGMLGTLSHLARLGLTCHLGSPLIMAGWDGHVTFELFNAGPAPLRLHHGMPLARLVLFDVYPTRADGTAPPHPFYGASDRLGSRYATEFADLFTFRSTS
jgi:deoxycytidine triphosphate deaminase